MSSQSKSLFGSVFGNALHFVKNKARPDDCDPILGWSFSFSHASFGRLLGDGLVREDSDPDPTTALDESRHGNSCGFDFSAAQPPTFDGLESKIAEIKGVASRGPSSRLSLLLFPIFCLCRLQHNLFPLYTLRDLEITETQSLVLMTPSFFTLPFPLLLSSERSLL